MSRIKLLEDITPVEIDARDNIDRLATAIADRMGNCEVIGNVIYFLDDDFEIWDDDTEEYTEVSSGIFLIIRINTDSIDVYDTKAPACTEIDNIGVKPMWYFIRGRFGRYDSLREFINAIDDYFGRGWFGDYDVVNEIIRDFGDVLPNDSLSQEYSLDEDVQLVPAHRVRYRSDWLIHKPGTANGRYLVDLIDKYSLENVWRVFTYSYIYRDGKKVGEKEECLCEAVDFDTAYQEFSKPTLGGSHKNNKRILSVRLEYKPADGNTEDKYVILVFYRCLGLTEDIQPIERIAGDWTKYIYIPASSSYDNWSDFPGHEEIVLELITRFRDKKCWTVETFIRKHHRCLEGYTTFDDAVDIFLNYTPTQANQGRATYRIGDLTGDDEGNDYVAVRFNCDERRSTFKSWPHRLISIFSGLNVLKRDINNTVVTTEDLQPSIVAFNTVDDVYDEVGEDLFEPGSLEVLRNSGLLDENGYPIKKYQNYRGEDREESMTLYDIYQLDWKVIKSEYIAELIKKEINDHFKGNITIRFYDTDIDYNEYSTELSDNFVRKCFRQEIFDDFMGEVDWNTDLSDCDDYLEYIPDTIIDELEKRGFPRNIFEQLVHGEADDNSPLSKYYDDLGNALAWSVDTGYCVGSADDCQDSFNADFEASMPPNCTYERIAEDYVIIHVSDACIEENLETIWDRFDYEYDIIDCLRRFIYEYINEELANNFKEPRYGWQEFSSDAFVDDLQSRVGDILDTIDKADEPEVSLFDFDDEEQKPEEQHEDLDLQPIKYPTDKPRKMYFKYQDYNKELSLKAWYLDFLRFRMLLEWAKTHDKELYKELDRMLSDDIDTIGSYSNSVILSTIKPSYAPSYEGFGFTVWGDEGYKAYNTTYLGAIPKDVGQAILKGVPIQEELQEIKVIQVPMEYDDERLIHENIEEDIIR